MHPMGGYPPGVYPGLVPPNGMIANAQDFVTAPNGLPGYQFKVPKYSHVSIAYLIKDRITAQRN